MTKVIPEILTFAHNMYMFQHLRATMKATSIYTFKNEINCCLQDGNRCKQGYSNRDNEGLTQTSSNQKNGKKYHVTFDLRLDEKQLNRAHTPISNPNDQSVDLTVQNKL